MTERPIITPTPPLVPPIAEHTPEPTEAPDLGVPVDIHPTPLPLDGACVLSDTCALADTGAGDGAWVAMLVIAFGLVLLGLTIRSWQRRRRSEALV